MRPTLQLLVAILAATAVTSLALAIATLMMGGGCVHKNAFQEQMSGHPTGFTRALPPAGVDAAHAPASKAH